MKKFCILAVLAGLFTGNAAFADVADIGKAQCAQPSNNSQMKKSPPAKNCANDEFAWGIGLVAVAVLGTVVGLTVASASSSPSSHSH